MAERKTEHVSRFPQSFHPDLRMLRNPRFLLSLLGLGGLTGTFVGIKHLQDYLNEPDKPAASQSQSIVRPPSQEPVMVNGEAVRVVPLATATQEASPTATAKPTETATATAAATATAIPKEVYWPLEKIIEEQNKAGEKGNLQLLQTWPDTIQVQAMQSYNKRPKLGFNGFNKGELFRAPIGGRVTMIGASVGNGYKLKTVVVEYNGIEFWYDFNFEDELLIKVGQDLTADIETNSPMAKLSGKSIPKAEGLSKDAQVVIYARKINSKTDYTLSLEHILSENGVPVRLTP